jgi:hypothetical protein
MDVLIICSLTLIAFAFALRAAPALISGSILGLLHGEEEAAPSGNFLFRA